MNIEGVEIGQGQPCRFVAEISNNHNGHFELALQLITAAKDAGADFVKFQCYTPAELVTLRGDGPAPEPWGSQGWTMEKLYEKARTPLEWFPDLFQYARDIGIVPFSSVFGWDSLNCLRAVNNPCYKISKFENNVAWLFHGVKATEKPYIVSSKGRPMHGWGMGKYPEPTLYCADGYPTELKNVHLPREFGPDSYLGLSSHCLAPELPVAAVSRGCKLIEMHFMLADTGSDLESEVSLTEHEYADMVASVRATEAMLAD